MNNKEVINNIVNYGVNERLDKLLLSDKKFQKLCAQKLDTLAVVEKMNLPKSDREKINELLSAYLDCSAYYGEQAYIQGLHDASIIILELGLIK